MANSAASDKMYRYHLKCPRAVVAAVGVAFREVLAMCYSVENEKRMKLFVAGEVNSDPTQWDGLSLERILVLAENKEQAAGMIDSLAIIEVRMDQAAIL